MVLSGDDAADTRAPRGQPYRRALTGTALVLVYNTARGDRRDEEEPMSEKQILSMLEQGTITADEAARLLEAVSTGPSADVRGASGAQEEASQHAAAVEPSQVIPGTLAPDARRWKRLQLIPLAVSLVVLIATAWGQQRRSASGSRGPRGSTSAYTSKRAGRSPSAYPSR
jgi:hypothetical protein